MSDLMLLGVLRMPVTPDSDYLTLKQYIDRGRQAADLIEQLQQQIEELAATVERLRDSLNELQANSVGVIGLHMNGDIATWDSLRQGGRFESWLIAFDETPQQNLSAIKREIIANANN